MRPASSRACDFGAGLQQRGERVLVASQRGFVQCAAALRVVRVDPRLVLEQQLHAGGIVFFAAGGGEQGRGRAGRLGFRAAFEQEARQAPVAGRTGHAERRDAVAVEHIEFRRGIAQQGGDARIGTARGVMQRRVAVRVARARIGAIGQQGHDRFGAPVPAVARGGEQRRHAGVRGIDVDAGCDQRAQQAQVGQHRGQHRQAALIAIATRR